MIRRITRAVFWKNHMKRIAWLLLIIAGVLGLWFALGDRSANQYRGGTAVQWESEIRRWSVGVSGWSNKGGRWTFWYREPRWWEAWLAKIGAARKHDLHEMPLLAGDAGAVPVLLELLRSNDSKARLIAAEGLERIGEKAKPAVPDLIAAMEDDNEDVRAQAEQSLFYIDREAAERAGLNWTRMGLARNRQ